MLLLKFVPYYTISFSIAYQHWKSFACFQYSVVV